MFRHNKTAAFVLSLMLCVSAAAPVCSVYAEGESTSSGESSVSEEASEETTEAAEEEEAEEEESLLTEGDYSYSVTDDGAVCLESYTGSDENLDIPAEIAGKTVAQLSDNLFAESAGAVTINIPAGVEKIGECFSRCEKLTAITVDAANETYYAQDGVLCKKAEDGDWLVCYPQAKAGDSFAVPENVVLLAEASMYNTQLTEIKMHSGVKSLSRHCLSYNTRLASIDLSGTAVDSLGDMTFAGCSVLEEVILPEGLTDTGAGTFAACSHLMEIELPEGLQIIGQNAFAGTGLTMITVPASVSEIGYCALGYDENLEPVSDFMIIGTPGTIAQTYCSDYDEDYDYYNDFTFVDVEDSALLEEVQGLEVLTSGDYSYAEKDGAAYIFACSSAEEVIEVPSEIEGLTVTRIYGGAFFGSSAKEIILPDTVKEIDNLAFYMCTNLKTVKLPASLEILKNQAFSDCTALETLEIPASCATIGNEVFLNCTALKAVEIPASCTSIGTEPFLNCTSLKEITVADGNTSFVAEDGVLYTADKSEIVAYPAAKEGKSYKAPDSVKKIRMSAFMKNTYLEKADISSVITIEDYAFEGCSALSYVKLSKDLDIIGNYAFYDCKALKSIRIYNKINEIGDTAIGFYYDANDTENGGDVPVEGFVVYADKDSGGHQFAEIAGLECKHGTIGIGSYNVEKSFLYAISGIAGAVVLAVIGVLTGKAVKKKKEEKNAVNESESGGKDNEENEDR